MAQATVYATGKTGVGHNRNSDYASCRSAGSASQGFGNSTTGMAVFSSWQSWLSNYALVGSTSFGSANSASNGPVSISFNSTGIAYVVPGGYCVIGLREADDLNNTPDTEYHENSTFAGPTHATTAYRPNLVIDYTVPTTVTPMMHMMGISGGLM